jgi:O-antigen ligase
MHTAARRGDVVALWVLGGTLVVTTAAVLESAPLKIIAPLLFLLALGALTWRAVTPWPRLLSLTILVVLFIPMRRYSLPVKLGVGLDPYRLLVALVLGGWFTSLLVDRRVTARRSGFEVPLFLVLVSAVLSEIPNHSRFAYAQSDVIKNLTFLFSFVAVFYFVVSVIRTREEVDRLVRVLVGGGAIVGALTLVESRTQYNVFNHLQQLIPLLRYEGNPYVGYDGRGYRAYGSAQHPISLGAALVMLLPLVVYLIRSTGAKRWWFAGICILFGALVTHSRTGVLMLAVIVFTYAWLRPRELKRFWPAMLPMLVALHFAAPGTIGTIKESFFPRGGVAALKASQETANGHGRIASLGPGIKEWKKRPIFGEGYATRVVYGPMANAPILDDQWLTTLLEVGFLGALAWGLLFTRAIRRFGRVGRHDSTPRGWFFVGITAAVTAYAASMWTYDAFAFIQVSFMLFIELALAVCLLRATTDD